MKTHLKLRLSIASTMLLFCLIVGYYRLDLTPNAMSIGVVSPTQSDSYQLFYDIGRGFNENDSIRATLLPAQHTVSVTFWDVPFAHIQRLRLDPGTRPGRIQVKDIRVQHAFRRVGLRIPLYTWTGNRLAEDFQPIHHITEFHDYNQSLQITAIGNDPHVQYSGDWSVLTADITSRMFAIKLYLTAFIGGIGWVIGWVFVEITNILKYALQVAQKTILMKVKRIAWTLCAILQRQFVYSVMLCCCILVFNAYLRLSMISGSLPYIGSVDEPAITQRAGNMLTTGDWNPHFFNYPSFPIYLTAAGLTIGYLNAASHLEIKHTKDIGSLGYPYFTHPRIVWPAKACVAILSTVAMGFLAMSAYKFLALSPAILWLIPAILTISQQYYRLSQVYINVDMIACFWIIAVYFAHARSLDRDTVFHKAFIPGVFSGCAIASKYTMFLILIPSLLMIAAYSKHKLWKGSILVITMIVSFFILVPYSLLDFPTFLNHVGFEVFHYKHGHAGYDGPPGFPQMIFYLKQLLNDFGWGSSVFVVVGLIIPFRIDWRKAGIFLSFPALFLLYMSSQKVHFVRNIVSLYAFYAVFAAIGVIGVYRGLLSLSASILKTSFSLSRISAISVCLVGMCMVLCFPVSRLFLWVPVTPDTRNVAVEWMTHNVPQHATVVVPTELFFDVRALEETHQIVRIPFKELTQETFYDALRAYDAPYVIMPNFVYDTRKSEGKELAERLNQLSSVVDELQRFSGTGGVSVNYPVSTPGRNPEFFIGHLRQKK